MPDKCEKHTRNLKIGLVLFGTNAPIVLLKKAGYIDAWFAHSMDVVFLLWILITGIATMKLVLPYVKCLTDYNRKHKLQ